MVGLGEDQILLRGSSLRNTGHIWGIAVYTGHDTKVMMNSSKGRVKFSKLELQLNRYIIMAITIQFLLCFVAAMINAWWTYVNFSDLSTGPFYLELHKTYDITIAGTVRDPNEQVQT